MRLSFTAEQGELRTTVRRLFSEQWSPDRRRDWLRGTDPYDEKLWTTMAEHLGLHGMALPEEYGGAGCGFLEQAVVLEEIGRSLVAAPYLSTVIGSATLLAGGDAELCRNWLPRVIAGDAVIALAHTDTAADWRSERPGTVATAAGNDWTVNGTKNFVVDGAQADLLIVHARTGDAAGDTALLAVPTADARVTGQDLPTLDLTRRMARVTLSDAPGVLLARGVQARRILDQALDLAAVGLACEQVGGTAAALEITVAYAKMREQFGAPIGSFQAIKFKTSDMLLALEAARSAALYAAAAVAAGSDEIPTAAAVAKSVCSDAFTFVTGEMIQILGGIGYTWEHDAHLYFKRAKASQHLFGDPVAQRARVADLVGI